MRPCVHVVLSCRPEAANAAIEKYNGQELHGRPLSVGFDKKLM